MKNSSFELISLQRRLRIISQSKKRKRNIHSFSHFVEEILKKRAMFGKFFQLLLPHNNSTGVSHLSVRASFIDLKVTFAVDVRR